MIESFLGESILRNLRPRILGFEAEIPETFQVRNIARQTTCHSHNCNLHKAILMSALGPVFFYGSRAIVAVA